MIVAMINHLRLLTLLALGTLAGSCGPAHVSEYTPKRRTYSVDAPGAQNDAPMSPGSLWHDGRPASMLFTDARALRVNDLLVIKIEEVADAKRSANTDLNRQADYSVQINEFLGQLSRLRGATPAITASSKSSFLGEGNTARSEHLTATVPAIVRKVLPNGNLFVEGHRVILVNSEEQHFYISGVVRPIDLDQENSVKSTMVADAEIEFVGKGVLTENQRQGWFSRYLGWLWPF